MYVCVYIYTYVNVCASTKGYVVTCAIFTDASRLPDTCIPILRQKLLILSLRSASRGASYPLASATRPRAGASEKWRLWEVLSLSVRKHVPFKHFLLQHGIRRYSCVCTVYIVLMYRWKKGRVCLSLETLQCTDAQIALTTC